MKCNFLAAMLSKTAEVRYLVRKISLSIQTRVVEPRFYKGQVQLRENYDSFGLKDGLLGHYCNLEALRLHTRKIS